MARKAAKSAAALVPQSLKEADELVRQIGEEQREIQLIETSFSEQTEGLRAKAASESSPHQERIKQLLAALFSYAQDHREELTQKGKKKTVKVTSGQFSWHLTPPSISLSKPLEEIIAALKRRRLTKFIIRKVDEVLDRKALSRAPDVVARVDGISIEQREEFVVEPTGGASLKETVESLRRQMPVEG